MDIEYMSLSSIVVNSVGNINAHHYQRLDMDDITIMITIQVPLIRFQGNSNNLRPFHFRATSWHSNRKSTFLS